MDGKKRSKYCAVAYHRRRKVLNIWRGRGGAKGPTFKLAGNREAHPHSSPSLIYRKSFTINCRNAQYALLLKFTEHFASRYTPVSHGFVLSHVGFAEDCNNIDQLFQ